MQKVCFLTLVALAVPGAAKRFEMKAAVDQEANATSSSIRPAQWTHVAAGFIRNPGQTQHFVLKEDDHAEMNLTGENWVKKSYTVDSSAVNGKVARVENHASSSNGYGFQAAMFYNENKADILVHKFSMSRPGRFTKGVWNVKSNAMSLRKERKDKVLFTMRRRSYDCTMGLFGCHHDLDIYVDGENDDSQLIYHGTGVGGENAQEFRFFQSRAANKADEGAWVAKVVHQYRQAKDKGDTYRVTVKPGEDSGLLLLAAIALDKNGDAHRSTITYDSNMGHNDG